MGDITICLYIGPSSSDLRELVVSAERPLGDLIIDWKKVYQLAEQDQQGEMIRYELYRDVKGRKERVDPKLSLRNLRFQPHQELYLVDAQHPWCLAGMPLPSRVTYQPGTEPLRGPATRSSPEPPRPPIAQPVGRPAPPPLASSFMITPCSIEIAPNCVRQIGESGVVINREYLLQELPPSVLTRERALVLIGLASRLSAVSRSHPGHCSLLWRQSWYLIAHSSLYIGSAKYSCNEAIQVDQTVTVLLGREGWPVTIRLHSTSISR